MREVPCAPLLVVSTLHRASQLPYFGMPNNNALLSLDLPGIQKLKSGKVREIFDLGESLLFVASDRISAFDVIMPNGIPRKGEVLTQISYFWFEQTESFQPNHLLSRAGDALPDNLKPFADKLSGRSMIVKKAKPLPIECVVRGYLSGSGWKEYRQHQTICGIKLPAGLTESAELPEPIFTPATKAETGHDENISFEQATELAGKSVTVMPASRSITLRAIMPASAALSLPIPNSNLGCSTGNSS
jgi:phosphoribosylaminoimidazole-succinocarboxamide synthase